MTTACPDVDPRRPRNGPTTPSATSELAWLRRLPAERRLRVDDDARPRQPRLARLADGRASTSDLDPSSTIERLSRTDARVICCGHTHMPEVRDFGWKLIVNAARAGYVFDGDPTASWALVDARRRRGSTAEIKRTEFDALAVADAISARGLPGDVYRAATVRTGKLSDERSAAVAPRRVVVTGMGAVTALGNDVATTWAGPGRRAVRRPHDRGLRPVAA